MVKKNPVMIRPQKLQVRKSLANKVHKEASTRSL